VHAEMNQLAPPTKQSLQSATGRRRGRRQWPGTRPPALPLDQARAPAQGGRRRRTRARASRGPHRISPGFDRTARQPLIPGLVAAGTLWVPQSGSGPARGAGFGAVGGGTGSSSVRRRSSTPHSTCGVCAELGASEFVLIRRRRKPHTIIIALCVSHISHEVGYLGPFGQPGEQITNQGACCADGMMMAFTRPTGLGRGAELGANVGEVVEKGKALHNMRRR
jgi:hypothetical protein